MAGGWQAGVDSLRLFVAVDLPEEVRQALRHLQEGVPGARWAPNGQLHLTLRFLGEADRARYERFAAELAAVRCPAFPLAVRGVGRFPRSGEPHILWAGCADTGVLTRLQGQVAKALAGVGLAPEERPFSAHITLGRLKDSDHTAVAEWLARHGGFAVPPFTVTRFHLYASTLSPGGAVHRLMDSWRLEAEPPPAP